MWSLIVIYSLNPSSNSNYSIFREIWRAITLFLQHLHSLYSSLHTINLWLNFPSANIRESQVWRSLVSFWRCQPEVILLCGVALEQKKIINFDAYQWCLLSRVSRSGGSRRWESLLDPAHRSQMWCISFDVNVCWRIKSTQTSYFFFVTYTELGCPWKEDFDLHGKGTRTISIFMDCLTSNFVHSGIWG